MYHSMQLEYSIQSKHTSKKIMRDFLSVCLALYGVMVVAPANARVEPQAPQAPMPPSSPPAPPPQPGTEPQPIECTRLQLPCTEDSQCCSKRCGDPVMSVPRRYLARSHLGTNRELETGLECRLDCRDQGEWCHSDEECCEESLCNIPFEGNYQCAPIQRENAALAFYNNNRGLVMGVLVSAVMLFMILIGVLAHRKRRLRSSSSKIQKKGNKPLTQDRKVPSSGRPRSRGSASNTKSGGTKLCEVCNLPSVPTHGDPKVCRCSV